MRLLQQKGIETFCPLRKAQSQWSDRVKTIEKPIFKSFVFVKIRQEQRTVVRLTEGVINFVYRDGKPVTVTEKLIQSIRQFQQDHCVVEVMEGKDPQEKESTGNSMGTVKGKLATLWIETLQIALIALPASPPLIEATTDNT